MGTLVCPRPVIQRMSIIVEGAQLFSCLRGQKRVWLRSCDCQSVDFIANYPSPRAHVQFNEKLTTARRHTRAPCGWHVPDWAYDYAFWHTNFTRIVFKLRMGKHYIPRDFRLKAIARNADYRGPYYGIVITKISISNPSKDFYIACGLRRVRHRNRFSARKDLATAHCIGEDTVVLVALPH